jgi:23S rRNA (guanosine2251-2'-O)-methyltransferase
MKKETYIYGIRPTIEAIKAGKELEKVFIQNGLRGEGFHELFSLIKEIEIPYQFVPIEKLNRLSRQNHQGVISYVSEITYQLVEDLVPFAFEHGKMPLFIILDRVTDVRNVGSIARTAECAGADGLIIPARGSAQINSDAIKTSAGALYKLPVVRAQNVKDTIQFLRNSGLTIVAATEKSDKDYTACDMNRPLAVIMGSEGEGISEEYLKLTDEEIRIPLAGDIESLNVSVATGVILFEVLRQRNLK